MSERASLEKNKYCHDAVRFMCLITATVFANAYKRLYRYRKNVFSKVAKIFTLNSYHNYWLDKQ